MIHERLGMLHFDLATLNPPRQSLLYTHVLIAQHIELTQGALVSVHRLGRLDGQSVVKDTETPLEMNPST